jgi:hypothetical protein
MPILAALAREPHYRHPSARDMAESLADALALHGGEPPRREIGEWVDTAFARLLQTRRELADPEIEVRPVEPSKNDDATVPFRQVPAEDDPGLDFDGASDVLTPTAHFAAPPTEPPIATPARRGLSSTAIIIFILFTAFGVGLGAGLGYVLFFTR